MNQTELAKQFIGSFQLHEVIDQEEYLDFELPEQAEGPFDAATRVLEAQAARRVVSDVEHFLNQPGRGRDLFENEENISVALLFIVARDMGGDVQLRNGPIVIGDHLAEMTEITIEVAARRRDFTIDFLISWHEDGPHPDWYPGAGDAVPHSLDVRKELALFRDDDLSGQPSGSDRKTRRGGLASLGLLVLPFERQEGQRDPFGLAKRALNDLKRAVFEEFVP